MPVSIYLWADNQGHLFALSPLHYLPLGQLTPPANLPANEQTRPNGIDAAGFLPEPLWTLLVAHHLSQITLILDRSLSRAWHTLAWEHLHWRGTKLGIRLQVIRYAQPVLNPMPRSGKTLIWDQWPGDEFAALIKGRHHIERRHKLEQIEQYIRLGTDVGHFARLIIIAHGGENEDVILQNKSRDPWDIQLPATLPPEVLLVACASYHGNFHNLAVACLERGAQSVICGHGPLNAELMNQALIAWLDGDTHVPAHEALLRLQKQDQIGQQGGVHWLRYYGDIPMRAYDRLTLDFFQKPDKPNPFEISDKTIDTGNTDAIRVFLNEIENETGYCSLTQYWLLPLALYWAEKYNHALKNNLKIRFNALTVHCDELLPERAYGLASVYRRDGKYPLAIAQLSEGLQSNPNLRQKTNLLGALLNDLIDFNLPEPGQTVLDQLDGCLTQIDNPTQDFRLYDRRARLALRQGKIATALRHLDCKRQEALNRYKEDSRELAGLLYSAAWFDDPKANHYANEALARLPQMKDIGDGNDNKAYLLRALAVWQWRQQQDKGVLSSDLVVCKERLNTQQDPGAFASLLIYHQLALGCCSGENWDLAIDGLERGRYWLELTAFHALAGQIKEAKRALKKFQDIRSNSLEALQTGVVKEIAWLMADNDRKQLENNRLLADIVTPNTLTQHGLLPL